MVIVCRCAVRGTEGDETDAAAGKDALAAALVAGASSAYADLS